MSQDEVKSVELPIKETSTSPSSSESEPVSPTESKWRFVDGTFANARDQDLYYCAYFPHSGTPVRGVVVFLHGIGEYARRFADWFDVLCARGFGVVAYDMVSHGRSDDDEIGLRAHVRRFQHFVDDANLFVTTVKDSVLPQFLDGDVSSPPMVLMGMSYGSLVSLHTVLSDQHTFDAIVLAAPAVSVEWTATLKFQRAVLTPVAKLIPRVRVTPAVNHLYLSRNPTFLADYMADSMVTKEKMTARMATETIEAMERVQHDARVQNANSRLCQLPMLFVQGSEDKVTSVPLAEEFYNRVASRDKEFRMFPGLYHCIFNEPERETVTDHICEWLTKRFPVEKSKA